MQSGELQRLVSVLGEFFPELQNAEVANKILTIGQDGDSKEIHLNYLLKHILASLSDGTTREEVE